jgi:hypothetical protein
MAETRYLGENESYFALLQVRQKMGKSTQPSAIAADSQSVKTTEKRGMCTALMVAN